MEVRCASCNKLFRVSDDKITGIGIKFACTRCQGVVKITREEFEQYSLSTANLQNTASSAASTASVPETPNQQKTAPAAAATMREPVSPAGKPASVADPGNGGGFSAASAVQSKTAANAKAEPKAAPAQSKPEIKAAPRPKPEPAAAAARPPVSSTSSAPASASPQAGPRPEPLAAGLSSKENTAAAGSSPSSNKVAIAIVALLVLVAGAFGVKSYLGKTSTPPAETVRVITSPEGLLVQNAAGAIDQTNQDLIITGTVQNTTDKARPAWYIIVEVYDAQTAVITRGRLLSGKQLYSSRDFEILTRRGAKLEDLRMKSLEQGITIPAKGAVNFEIRLMEPPVGIASFNVTLQPFDPVQLFKEIAEEQK